EDRQQEQRRDQQRVVADDWPYDGHLERAARDEPALGKFVNSVDDQLQREDEEQQRGDLEEALQVDAQAAANEEITEENGEREPGERADEGVDPLRVETQRPEHQHRLHPLAEDGEEGEEGEAEPGG